MINVKLNEDKNQVIIFHWHLSYAYIKFVLSYYHRSAARESFLTYSKNSPVSPETAALHHSMYKILLSWDECYLTSIFWHCISSLTELASKILMSKITSAYSGLAAMMVVLVTESTLGQVPLAGSSHMLGYYYLWLTLRTLGLRCRQSQRSLETSGGEQSLPCCNIRKKVGIIKCMLMSWQWLNEHSCHLRALDPLQ